MDHRGELLQRVKNHEVVVGIVGLGYVGPTRAESLGRIHPSTCAGRLYRWHAGHFGLPYPGYSSKKLAFFWSRLSFSALSAPLTRGSRVADMVPW